jgi:CheY-like chemotaxis protein
MKMKQALIVDDEPLQRRGVRGVLETLGYMVADCNNAEGAFDLLRKNGDYSLIMVDKSIPEHQGDKDSEHIGSYLVLRIAREFPFAGYLVLYTALSEPNVGDIRQVYQAGASALAAPSGSDERTFANAVEMVATGHQVLSPRFRHFGIQALDPDNQCPLNQVEYYCVRLIAEHRGKEGAAEKWGPPVTVHMIDDLLEDIYAVMSFEIDGFTDLPKEKKSVNLAEWYHDKAVKLYGVAIPVPYEPRRKRRKLS